MIELIAWSNIATLAPLFAVGGEAEGLVGWFEALAETTLAPDETAVIVAAREGGAVRAALPAAQSCRGLRLLTAPYTTRYAPALPELELARAMAHAMRGVSGGVLRLEAADPSNPGMAAFLDGLGGGLAVARYQGFANWYEPVSDFASYWRQRPSRLKTTVRRKLAAAEATFTYVREDFEPALAAYESIRAGSWKSPEPHPAFLPAMVRRLAPSVRMGLLAIGGETVAAQIWLVHGGRATIFKLAHREDAAALSPGTLLTYRMIETCLGEEPVTVLDFGRGDDAYKRDWMGSRAMRLGVIAADWRCGNGLKAIAGDVLPTWAGRVLRRHLPGNRIGSVAAREGEALAGVRDRGRVPAAEASP